MMFPPRRRCLFDSQHCTHCESRVFSGQPEGRPRQVREPEPPGVLQPLHPGPGVRGVGETTQTLVSVCTAVSFVFFPPSSSTSS